MKAAEPRCDLHLHSDRSDGTQPPREVVRLAREAGLAAMALTDHDTFAGVDEAVQTGAALGVRVVSGVELSLDHAGTFHMIALGVDTGNERMRRVVDTLRGGRDRRNLEMLSKLRALGIELELADVERYAGGDVVARPHFARALVTAGHVRDAQDAFERYLGKGAAAYVDRARVTVEEAVAATREAGGVTIICHPFTLGYDSQRSPEGEERMLAFLAELVAAGVDAIEARYGAYSAQDERYWEGVAERVGLMPSGGSDYHGTAKVGLRVGSGRGRLRVPLAWLDDLLALAAARTP